MSAHRGYFAQIKEAWDNLAEEYANGYPSPEHMRAAALVDPDVLDLEALPDAIQACLREARVAPARPVSELVDLRAQPVDVDVDRPLQPQVARSAAKGRRIAKYLEGQSRRPVV